MKEPIYQRKSHMKLEKTLVFDTTIPRCTKAAESTGIGESIFQYDPKGAATKAYEAFTKEVILNAEKEHKRHKSSYVR